MTFYIILHTFKIFLHRKIKGDYQTDRQINVRRITYDLSIWAKNNNS